MKTIQIKNEIKDILNYIISFYKNPFQHVKKVPSWTWLSLFCLNFIFSSVTGVLRGLFSGSLFQSIIGFFFLPISSFIAVAGIASFCYFSVVVFKNRNLNFKRLFTLTFVAFLPTVTMYALSLIHPTVTIVGITFSFLLLAFGLITRFQLGKNFIWLTVGSLYALVFCVWIFGYLNMNSDNRTKDFINKESRIILENELSN